MYSYEIIPSLQKKLKKLSKKDHSLYEQIIKKIEEILSSNDIEHYKNLRYTMKDRKRAHIGSFVLVFKFLKSENKIVFQEFNHHDNIYKR
jgi:YafQ family addiction module toxin component